MITFWTIRDTGEHGAKSKMPRNSTHANTAPVVTLTLPVESPSVGTPNSPQPGERLATPEGQKAHSQQPSATTKPSTAEQTPDYSILNDPAAKEKLGRQSLSYVGADPEADEIWAWLINDPDLSPKVREDLIEDLNENGFSDGNGRRPTTDDLPLIENRILLIEEHAPFAMDAANAAAFAEAYKDLANMWWRLSR
jgi:hypothetical protein